MRHAIRATLIVGFLAPSLLARDEPRRNAETPRERYQALLKDYRTATRRFWATFQSLKTQEEQQKFFKEQSPNPRTYLGRFLEIAESSPQDPAAVDALIWIVQNGGCDPEVHRAIERLAKDHAGARKLGAVAPSLVPGLVYSLSTSAEDLLRSIISKNPDRVAQGQACMALADYLRRESGLVQALRGDTAQARQMRSYYQMQGADEASFKAIRTRDPQALAEQSEAMFTRAAKDYADVADFLRIVDPRVQARLFENPDLAIGKPAPEIAGEAIDGRPLKLSDHKGKVVVLLFWGDWNGPSRAMYPLAKSFMTRMEGRPFVLLGVNSDKDKELLNRRVREEHLDWRSWWDGGGAHGPIAKAYDIPGWPTLYILDHHGIIRHKFLGAPNATSFDIIEVLENLTAEASHGTAASKPIPR